MPWARSSSVFQKRYNFLGVSFIPFHKSVSPTHIFLQVLNLMKMTIRYCRYPNQSSLSSHFLLSIPTPVSPLFQIRALPITQFLEVETSVILFHHQPFTFTSVFKFCQFFSPHSFDSVLLLFIPTISILLRVLKFYFELVSLLLVLLPLPNPSSIILIKQI